jgi:hypothetical protein
MHSDELDIDALLAVVSAQLVLGKGNYAWRERTTSIATSATPTATNAIHRPAAPTPATSIAAASRSIGTAIKRSGFITAPP